MTPASFVPLAAAFLTLGAFAREPAPAPPHDDPIQAAVRSVFETYKTALLEGDGETAARLVDDGTLEYFREIRLLAVSGAEDEVRGRPFVDRLLVVTMRHELAADVLAAMELEDLLRHAIESGWIAKASIRQLGMGTVVVDGDEATGLALTQGAVSPEEPGVEPLRYAFIRTEDGSWRFRFSTLVESLNRIISSFTRQLGTNEDDLIFTLVQGLSDRQVMPEVWQPVESPPG